ncbi:receptor-like protein 19 [Hibiscus syriacus]|uniref:receptor-like protein 19 n=1 Tax=Hibiscus syriacus TaxID=106335 RepID=UPI001923328E|nr:receptor-like protein 19 [Hibiscus syriacus]
MDSISSSSSNSVVIAMVLASIFALVHSITLRSDTEALQALRRSIDPNMIPPSSYISSWDFSVDPVIVPARNSWGFWNLTELTSLDLSRNQFRGPLPDTLKNLKKLTTLSLSGNFFTGGIAGWINGLKNVESIDLSENLLSGPIPMRISEFHYSIDSLIAVLESTQCFLQSTHFDRSEHSSWKRFAASGAERTRNRLQGHLPVSLVNFENLQVINLGYNGLTGRIPLAYGQRLGRPWRSLFLDDNFLSGRIPRQFNSMATGSVEILLIIA